MAGKSDKLDCTPILCPFSRVSSVLGPAVLIEEAPTLKRPYFSELEQLLIYFMHEVTGTCPSPMLFSVEDSA